jgi:C1A family cysteine protease
MAYRAAPPRARTLLALAITIAAFVQHSAAANTRSLTSARALASHSRGFENEHEARAASALWKQWLDSGDDSSMGALHAAWVQEHHTTEGGRAAAAADPARFSNFKATLGRIAAINADTTKTWFAGLNDRADLPRAQQLRPVMSVPFLKATADDNSTYRKVAKSYDGPPDVDWRAKGAVTPVKDQGSCGSCWAFATIGALESAILVAGGSSSDLSEEYLVSCFYAGTKEDGCQGGWPDQAAEFIAKNGVPTESALPYTDGKSGKASACPKPAKPIAAVSNGVGTVEHSASGLLTAVSKRPAAFAMFVDKDISLYSGGIYKSKMTNPNHAMLLVR